MAMQRVPVPFLRNLQLTTALAGATATTPTNAYDTINAAELNNTTVTARLVTVHIVPAGSAANAGNQVGTTLTVPPAGSAPTLIPGIIGQHLNPGDSLQMLADAAAAVTPYVSVYRTTL